MYRMYLDLLGVKQWKVLMKPYNFTMGIVGFIVAGTTAKSLTDSFNRRLESTNQINFISTMMAQCVVSCS